jgi:hypothetical protein
MRDKDTAAYQCGYDDAFDMVLDSTEEGAGESGTWLDLAINAAGTSFLDGLAEEDSSRVDDRTLETAGRRYEAGAKAGAEDAMRELRQRWDGVWIAQIGIPGENIFNWESFGGYDTNQEAKKAAEQWIERRGTFDRPVYRAVTSLKKLENVRWRSGFRVFQQAFDDWK